VGYPPYSSYRTDAAGTRILFESLSRLPGLEVERNTAPLEWLSTRQSTIVVVGVPVTVLDNFAETVEKLARQGNRVVVAFHRPKPKNDDEAKPSEKRNVETKPEIPIPALPIEERWKFRFAQRDPIEKAFGDGQVLILPDAAVLRNAAFVDVWSPRAVAGYIGDHSRVIFDESHLGLEESGSIVGLARRYRLHGFALGAAIVAALFLWAQMSAFPPPQPSLEGIIAGRASSAGMAALLGQNVPAGNLVETAWAAWQKGRPKVPAIRAAQARKTLESQAGGNPVEVLRTLYAQLAPGAKTRKAL
jgi:hypothetical protein